MEMNKKQKFCRILPCAAAAASKNPIDKGWRVRVKSEDGYSIELTEEQVPPERVNNPRAVRIRATLGTVKLTPTEARWLRDVIDEHLNAIAKDGES
jgi:hypothetical protein